MRVKIEFLRDDAEQNLSASIETQHKRGDTFTIHRAEQIMNGDSQTFTVPSSGRLVINMPTATEKPVYDRVQGAAVLASAQTQALEGADRPDMQSIIRTKEQELEELKSAEAAEKERQANIDAENARMVEEKKRLANETQKSVDAKNATIRTPPTGGQPLSGGTVTRPNSAPVHSNESPNSVHSNSPATPGGATADASNRPNPSPASQPSSPAKK